MGIDGDGDGKVLGGEFAEGDLIGKKGGDDILCPLSRGILTEAEEQISSEVDHRKVVGGVVDVGGGDREAGGKLELGEVG